MRMKSRQHTLPRLQAGKLEAIPAILGYLSLGEMRWNRLSSRTQLFESSQSQRLQRFLFLAQTHYSTPSVCALGVRVNGTEQEVAVITETDRVLR